MAGSAGSHGRPSRVPWFFAGWGGLGRFWLLVAVVLGLTGGVLQYLGPPLGRSMQASPLPVAPARVAPASARAQPPIAVERHVPLAPPLDAGRALPGPIADPDPALQEPGPGGSPAMLPRTADDGRQPMQVYAAGFDNSTSRPRIGVLIAGIGLGEADSLAAIRTLPGGVSLAVSPYGESLPRLLAAARITQHEYLLSIPMEPQGYPMNDPGSDALMTGVGRDENMHRLLQAMARFAGYVGATGALGDMRGERFAGLSDQMEPVLQEIARRGLLYVDPRPGAGPPPLVWGRDVDLVIDDPVDAQSIDSRLAELETIARGKGSALGLAGAPRPVTIERLAAWTATLTGKGFALAPVSALVQPPPKDTTP